MSRNILLRGLAVLAAVIVTLTAGWALPAQAHGNIQNPPSRNVSCWERWGADVQNPAMATQDPMCWQAWQADPNAMWNWNGHRPTLPPGPSRAAPIIGRADVPVGVARVVGWAMRRLRAGMTGR